MGSCVGPGLACNHWLGWDLDITVKHLSSLLQIYPRQLSLPVIRMNPGELKGEIALSIKKAKTTVDTILLLRIGIVHK